MLKENLHPTKMLTIMIIMLKDKVSANTASCGSQCYEKSDGSQDALRGSPDMKVLDVVES